MQFQQAQNAQVSRLGAEGYVTALNYLLEKIPQRNAGTQEASGWATITLYSCGQRIKRRNWTRFSIGLMRAGLSPPWRSRRPL